VDEYDLTEAGSAGGAADSLQKKYREVDKKVTRLNQKVEALDGDVADIETDIQDKEAELDELKSEREDAEAAVEDAEADLEAAESTLNERKAKRDEAVASVLDIDPVDVDQETESEVEAHQADLQKQLQDARGEIDAARQRQDSLEDQIEETESERESAKAELQTIQDRLDSEVDDPETAFRDAIDRADEIGTEFGIEVTPDTIEGALTTEIPAKFDTALDTYKDAADEVGRLKGELRFHEERLEIIETADTDCPTCGQAVDGGRKGNVQEDIETDVSSARNALADAEATREAARERIDRLNALSAAALEAASLRALANVMGDIESIEAQLETLQADLDNAKADEANAQAEHERIEDLLAAVDKAVETFDAVNEGQVELAEAESTLDEAERELASVKSDIRSIESELSSLESELNDVEQERDEKQTALTDARARRDEVAAARDAAEAAVETHDRISELQRQIDTARERRTDKRTQLTSLESDLDDAQDELTTIKEDIGDTKRDELDSLIDDLDETIDKIEGRIDSIRSEIGRLQNEYGAVNNRLDDLREKRELASAFEDRVEWARSIERDLESLSDVYEEVRTERRDDLIQALQARSNEVFRDLYHSESYSGLRVKPGYQVVLVDAEGTERDPKKASGGESVIATIALRAGVYRVLSDIHGNSSTLPPFILDEPTTYLDDEHVGKIEGVVTNIRQWNVPQVFVVSHDTGLVHDADQELQVSKDPATDRSQVTIRRNGHAADGGRGGAD